MAETGTTLKRLRDDAQVVVEEEETKRHKSYNQILSLLDDEEDEPNQDLSSLITSLQEELSSEPATSDPLPESDSLSGPSNNNNENPSLVITPEVSSTCSSSTSSVGTYEDDEDKERVMRHLLEASDDELGIPQSDFRFDEEEDLQRVGFGMYDGFWEFEDENANYYTLLQSELFM